jgi:isopentenyl diphosphate isomerase/L-lactate dehydrogenase-like FMN-dependent dehydrogenase
VTPHDTRLALRHGADGLIVSSHGGRSEESGRSTIESWPEVVEAVGGLMPVLVDSGFRRGSDIVKALALGANAVCVGRPCRWGPAAFGQEGVERTLEILRAALETTMRSIGAASVERLRQGFVRRA